MNGHRLTHFMISMLKQRHDYDATKYKLWLIYRELKNSVREKQEKTTNVNYDAGLMEASTLAPRYENFIIIFFFIVYEINFSS